MDFVEMKAKGAINQRIKPLNHMNVPERLYHKHHSLIQPVPMLHLFVRFDVL
jgi:hypothetical protein